MPAYLVVPLLRLARLLLALPGVLAPEDGLDPGWLEAVSMVGRRYVLREEVVEVLVQWRTGAGRGGPKNVLVERADGRREVRPWWRGRRVA